MSQKILLVVDSRGRISLGGLRRFGHVHGHFLGSLERDGTIVLTPAVVMPLERSQELHEAENILRERRIAELDEPPF